MGWGKGGGKTGCVHTDRGGEGVLCHIAGEPGQRWKNLSSEKQLMWEEMSVLFARACVHAQAEWRGVKKLRACCRKKNTKTEVEG